MDDESGVVAKRGLGERVTQLRVGIIGAGIADRHVGGFAARKDLFEVRVLCSLDVDRGRLLAVSHGIAEFCESFDEVIARDDIDVVDICTPPDSHFALARRALEAGKHVICEKPLFGSLASLSDRKSVV